MAKTSFNRKGALSRVTVGALTAALVVTGTSAVAADNPQNPTSKAGAMAYEFAKSDKTGKTGKTGKQGSDSRRGVASLGAAAEYRWLYAISGENLYDYEPNGRGGYYPRTFQVDYMSYLKNAVQADNDGDGVADDIWLWDTYGYLSYGSGEGDFVEVGGGWNMFNKVISPGDLGGASSPDLIARDAAGNLWIYLGYGNGKLTARTKIGGGWNTYNQIAGVGDLTGDGRADIVGADKSGVLWLHQGTGDRKAPFKARTKIGGGWNAFNYLLGVGDLDSDGMSDLIARDKAGALYRYSGTGTAKAPFKPKAKIGTGGWNAYRLMF
jgi:hypothetical protein